jgi:hypothetical protein
MLSSYSCKATTSKLTCYIENYEDAVDGHLSGTFVLTETKDGVIVSATTNLVLTEFGPEFGINTPYTLAATTNPEHKIFTLKKVSSANCEVK